MSDSERNFEINGKKFKLNKIDAMKQFHIVRRIGPILSELLPGLGGVAKQKIESLSQDEQLALSAKVMTPLMAGLSKLSDSDADYVLFRLLNSVEFHQEQFNSWARIANDTGIMMQDLDLPILLQAAFRALMYNLQSFFATLQRT